MERSWSWPTLQNEGYTENNKKEKWSASRDLDRTRKRPTTTTGSSHEIFMMC